MPWPALIGAGIVLALFAAFGINRAVSAGRVIGSVQLDGIELGGLTASEAELAIGDHEALLAELPAEFTVRSTRVALQPLTVGFTLDRPTIVARAMAVGRGGTVPAQFWWWLTHLFQTTEIRVVATVSAEALESVLGGWDEEAVGNPPFPGAVSLEGTTPVAEYPRAGEQIDRVAAPELMLGVFSTVDRPVTALPIVEATPQLTEADIDRAVARARLILSGPVTLINPEREKEHTFTETEIASALRSAIDTDGVVFTMEPEVVSNLLEPVRAQLEDPPVDAEFQIDGDQVTIIPGRAGTLVDDQVAAENLLEAAASASRRGQLPIEDAVDPEVTTEELEALSITHKVSEFTTYHDCCQNRVTNIHLIADEIDGSIVMPGASFSLNRVVGERTEEEGYLADGTIIGGEIIPTVGGGVSQFATTFYNAVFWGGYEDISHKPHSFYISRYPLGIEATISWPVPDLEFRNNTDQAILIKTSYTNSSITVMFFSDNDGRIVSGEQRSGSLRVSVVAEGGPNARVVSATVSDRYNFRDPPSPLYRGDPGVAPEEEEESQSPLQGFSVTVTRAIDHQGQTATQEWTVVYSPRRQIILVNPCTLDESCPTTTTAPVTTTTAPTTTTTAPATTTTTS
jgi:vancomycin resistance protein YoaR